MNAFICDAIRTPFGRYGGALATVRPDDLGALPINALMEAKYGIDSMPETAENVAQEFNINRADQDALALRSQQRWAAAHAAGFFQREIVPVGIAQKKGDPKIFDTDEHPRPDTAIE